MSWGYDSRKWQGDLWEGVWVALEGEAMSGCGKGKRDKRWMTTVSGNGLSGSFCRMRLCDSWYENRVPSVCMKSCGRCCAIWWAWVMELGNVTMSLVGWFNLISNEVCTYGLSDFMFTYFNTSLNFQAFIVLKESRWGLYISASFLLEWALAVWWLSVISTHQINIE